MGVKGWHSRGYLPHYDGSEIVQHVVFHLHDATLPNEPPGDDVLDRGLGSALLREAACGCIVAEALLYDDGRKYALHAWCVMPNHVHVLVATKANYELGKIVREWKTITARRINERAQRNGSLWAADYFGRYMRDQSQYDAAKQYIERNPVTAGLCERPEDWLFSSGGWK
jgi:REP element-mobilizing transposase RayT